MAKDWVFEEVPAGSQYFIARRGACVIEVWFDKETGAWLGGGTLHNLELGNRDELFISANGNFESFELAKLAAIDRLRELVETIHADFRGV